MNNSPSKSSPKSPTKSPNKQTSLKSPSKSQLKPKHITSPYQTRSVTRTQSLATIQSSAPKKRPQPRPPTDIADLIDLTSTDNEISPNLKKQRLRSLSIIKEQQIQSKQSTIHPAAPKVQPTPPSAPLQPDLEQQQHQHITHIIPPAPPPPTITKPSPAKSPSSKPKSNTSTSDPPDDLYSKYMELAKKQTQQRMENSSPSTNIKNEMTKRHHFERFIVMEVSYEKFQCTSEWGKSKPPQLPKENIKVNILLFLLLLFDFFMYVVGTPLIQRTYHVGKVRFLVRRLVGNPCASWSRCTCTRFF